MKIEMTRKQATKLGLLICQCGYPKNNHFDFGKKLCAHNSKCKGYKETARYGRIIK